MLAHKGNIMRDTLSILIMEGPDGKIAFELYKDGPKALEAFANLVGKPGDSKSRATFLHLDQTNGSIIHHEVKNLPMDEKEEPWGHELGVGPIDKPEPDGLDELDEISEEDGNDKT